jgi:hypothetical protein
VVGIAFAVLLLVAAGMVSVPTADDPASKIVSFYAAHGSIVLVAQVVGVLALVPLVAFILALTRRAPNPASARRIMTAGILVVVTELASQVPPSVLAFASAPSWMRWFGVIVAALAFVRAVGSPLGFTSLDAIAPLAFIVFVVVLSVHMLRARTAGTDAWEDFALPFPVSARVAVSSSRVRFGPSTRNA